MTETRRFRAESGGLSPLGHVLAFEEAAQRCFSWAVLLLWLKRLFVPEHLYLQLESEELQIPAQAFGLMQ